MTIYRGSAALPRPRNTHAQDDRANTGRPLFEQSRILSRIVGPAAGEHGAPRAPGVPSGASVLSKRGPVPGAVVLCSYTRGVLNDVR